ncbi:MAG: sigma-54 dependent transcriptional regulator [Candidatus Cloacimonadaceae bacterium]|jgi:DNA-binding NtrC family response regulator|nr:RNA repair transcriptional activator RtcR family protein [Candidatus Cloacimonadota bacterium]MDX9949150.1 sigma-54 dependent transcriptional regulator [Candidatus Syntrophosphaera sp.]
MKKILITFIGNNDCYLREGKEGAIISILKERDFNYLYILYNDTRYLEFASDILLYCQKKFPKLTVRYHEAESLNPIDYNVVYPSMVAAVKSILKEEGSKDIEYTISLTSGTPTMHSCWILIVMGGIINAKLIQSSREEGIQDVDFSLDDFPQISSASKAKIELTKTNRENKLLRKQLLDNYASLIGEHKSITQVKQQIDNLAKYDIPVFIGGESGTGKEVVSKLLHYNSPRKEGPFVAVNCGSISENLFESEFFGHKKGSFTGAIADHDGYFSQANKGTLFMDEVGDLPLPMQVKLLRVLEEGTIQPVGGKTKHVNVRILAASNKDLNQLVKENRFREDLFYRIVQAQIFLSPLRDRGSDILLLARHFLNEFSSKNRAEKHFSDQAERKLLAYKYPGNVRQLQNIVKLAYIHSRTELIETADIHLPDVSEAALEVEIPSEGIDLERDLIPAYYQAAMKLAKNNASEAARLLGLKPHTFRARLKALESK